MPIIRVEMYSGRSTEQKSAFTREVTEAFVRCCGGTPQSVQVVFYDVERSNWGSNGRLASEPAPPQT
jgi:4-oxalocrotonate tautomerase